MTRKVARIVMMQDVRLRDQSSGDWPALTPIGIFKPMKYARGEVGDQDSNQNFQSNHAALR